VEDSATQRRSFSRALSLGVFRIYIALWLFNIAIGNGPFIDGLPFLKIVIFHGYVNHNQMVVLVSLPHGTLDLWQVSLRMCG
jgi:hypothetical protein